MDNPLSVLLGAATMLVYAFVIVMLKDFSKHYNVFVIGVCYLPIQFIAMGGMLWMTTYFKGPLPFPKGSMWWLVLVLGMLYTLGSTLNYTAYATGGSVAMMSCMTLLMPLFASAINFVLTRELPNAWQASAYVAGTVTLLLLIKGSMVAHAAKVAAIASN